MLILPLGGKMAATFYKTIIFLNIFASFTQYTKKYAIFVPVV